MLINRFGAEEVNQCQRDQCHGTAIAFQHSRIPDKPLLLVRQVRVPLKEGDAAMVAVANVLLNLDETLTKP